MNSSSSQQAWRRALIALILSVAALGVVLTMRAFGGGSADVRPPAIAVKKNAAEASTSNGDAGSEAEAGERSEPMSGVPGAPLVGTVVDEQGRPVAGAEVAAGPRATVATDVQTNVVRALDPARSRSTRTDASGAFRIDGLATGAVDVLARAPGYFPAAVVDLKIDASPIPALLLRLSPGRTLEGTVTSVFGQAIADASVVVDVMDWQASDAVRIDAMLRRTVSDSAGRFRVEGLPAMRPLRARATARGYLSGKAVRIGATERIVAIQLDASPMVILQIIDLDSGAVLPDATLAFADDTTASMPNAPLLLRGEQARQCLGRDLPAGAVAAVDLPLRSVAFSVRAVDHALARIDVQGLTAGEVRERLVELEPEARLAGQITTANGEPAAAATIRVFALGNADATDQTQALLDGNLASVDPLSGFGPRTRPDCLVTTSDASGRFELGGLGAGPYRVSVEVDGHQDLVPPLAVELDRGPNEIEPIVLPDCATLQCAVLDAGGRPLAGASVTVLAYFDSGEGVGFLEDLAEPLATAVTDNAGNAKVAWLSPGRIVVRARIDPDAEPEQDGRSEVELLAGRTAGVTVRLPDR